MLTVCLLPVTSDTSTCDEFFEAFALLVVVLGL
jgi:hypothetical protein